MDVCTTNQDKTAHSKQCWLCQTFMLFLCSISALKQTKQTKQTKKLRRKKEQLAPPAVHYWLCGFTYTVLCVDVDKKRHPISSDPLLPIFLMSSVFVSAMWRVSAAVTWICGWKLNPAQLDKWGDVIGGSKSMATMMKYVGYFNFNPKSSIFFSTITVIECESHFDYWTWKQSCCPPSANEHLIAGLQLCRWLCYTHAAQYGGICTHKQEFTIEGTVAMRSSNSAKAQQ